MKSTPKSLKNNCEGACNFTKNRILSQEFLKEVDQRFPKNNFETPRKSSFRKMKPYKTTKIFFQKPESLKHVTQVHICNIDDEASMALCESFPKIFPSCPASFNAFVIVNCKYDEYLTEIKFRWEFYIWHVFNFAVEGFRET